jgi:hypothetical protein
MLFREGSRTSTHGRERRHIGCEVHGGMCCDHFEEVILCKRIPIHSYVLQEADDSRPALVIEDM